MHQDQQLWIAQPTASRSITLREAVAAGFRHRLLLATSFGAILIGTVLAAIVSPRYEAHLKIVIKNERVDPIVTPGPNAPPQPVSRDIVEEEEAVNSEIELLKSDDLLQKVVVATGLSRRGSLDLWKENPQIVIAKAARHLAKHLDIQPIKKTNVIQISYTNSDPQLAARVLNTLASLYVDKHLEVHRTPEQYKFFAEFAEDYRKKLLDAEAKLSTSGSVAPHLMRDIAVQKYNEFSATLAQTQAAIKETEQRIHALEHEQNTTPSRLTTQVRRSDNPQLLQQLKGTLLSLELKRTELLTKFQPTYRPVQELDKQIAETRDAIEREESAPMHDETTDRNPTYQWVNAELAKARAELVGLQARAAATEGIIRSYNSNAFELEQQSITHDDLERAARTAEENYLLYVRKAEEARISDELDRKRILNVAISQPAGVPLLPMLSWFQYLAIGCVLAFTGSIALVFAAEYLDSSYRTPDDVYRSLQLPVLAALPSGNDEQPQREDSADTGLGGAESLQKADRYARNSS